MINRRMLLALKLLLKHEGARLIDGSGIRSDSPNLVEAKNLAREVIKEAEDADSVPD